MEFNYEHPGTKLRYGRGRRDEVGEIVSEFVDEGKVLIVTTRDTMQDEGFLGDVKSSIDDEDLEYIVHDDTQPNPTVDSVTKGIAAVWEDEPKAVVAMGGGSVIDTAKVIAAGLESFESPPENEEVWAMCLNDELVKDCLPVVAVPSTSGTGSHTDSCAAISNEHNRAKPCFGTEEMVPKYSVVDPDILDKISSKLAARTGFEAFCQLSEAYVAESANPMSDVFARKGLELVTEYLPESVNEEEDDRKVAREKMGIADTLGGVSQNISMTIASHALSHSICAFHPSVSHGEALAAVAHEVTRYNVENGDDRTKKRYGKVAEFMNEPIADAKLDAPYAVEAFEKLRKRIGLDVALRDLGVHEDELEHLADNALEYMKNSIDENPVELERENLITILENSY